MFNYNCSTTTIIIQHAIEIDVAHKFIIYASIRGMIFSQNTFHITKMMVSFAAALAFPKKYVFFMNNITNSRGSKDECYAIESKSMG